jgi:putative salt-induced outer membrane protein YdiY
MSRVKKAVLFIIAVFVLVMITMPVQAKGSAKFGLTQINSDSTVLNASADQNWELDYVDLILEADYVFKKQDDITKMDEFNIISKVNKGLTGKYYTFGVLSYGTDKLRASGDRIVGGAGLGMKLFRNDHWKVSHETSVAYLSNDEVSEAILRNSLWVFYKLDDNLNVTNKLLHETGTDTYLRNETAINYNLSEAITVGFSNTYTEDPIDNNVLSITLGVKW